jgi:hypothetical protein
MKVDTRPFPGINMVEGPRDSGERSARRHKEEKGDSPSIGPERRKEVHHRRTGETCVVSAASLRASTQEILIPVLTASPVQIRRQKI